jgi:hypothetical protein
MTTEQTTRSSPQALHGIASRPGSGEVADG